LVKYLNQFHLKYCGDEAHLAFAKPPFGLIASTSKDEGEMMAKVCPKCNMESSIASVLSSSTSVGGGGGGGGQAQDSARAPSDTF